MNKLLISTAVAAAVIIPAVAAAGTSLYGDIRFSVADRDDDGAAVNDVNYQNNASRLGVKGSYDGGNGMSAIFHVQMGLDSVDSTGSANTALKNRFAFGGIKGGFGKLVYGTMSTPYKMAGLKLDPFYDVSGVRFNMNGGNNGGGSSHGLSALTNGWVNSTIAYTTPTMAGFNANVVFVGDDDTDATDDHINYGVSYAGMGATATVQFIDTGSDDSDAIRFAASYAISGLKLGVSIEKRDNMNGAGNDQDNLFISAQYDLNPKLTLAAAWGDQDADGSDLASDGSAYHLGVIYKLFDKTEIRATYADADSDLAGNDATVFSVGISQKFSM